MKTTKISIIVVAVLALGGLAAFVQAQQHLAGLQFANEAVPPKFLANPSAKLGSQTN